MFRITSILVTGILVTGITAMSATTGSADASGQNIHDRMLHHRAIDAIVWGMPLLNFKTARDGHAAIGCGQNTICYNSKVQDWKFQAATPNDTTPYVNFFWNVKNGPIVVEIPQSGDGVGIFGTLMDAWQRPLEDVGAKGKDQGRGAKYLLLPPGYDGPIPTAGYVALPQRTYNGFAVLRPIIADAGPENLKKATAFAKKIKIYPLAKADNPPATPAADIYGKVMEGIIKIDQSVFSELHEIIQEEVIDRSDLAMMGLLKSVGIQKGAPFRPEAKLQKIHTAAASEALEFMIEQYHQQLTPFVFEGKKWSGLLPVGGVESSITYEFPNFHDYHARGVLYYAVITSVKNYGTATYYLDLAEDKDGKWLDGGSTYKLNVPANVPARDFWSVVAYDLESAAWIRDMKKVGVSSKTEGLKKNDDGSYDVYFGPQAPEGKEANWIPTKADHRFFLLFRFYGPEPAVFDGSYQLNDIELIQ